MNGPEKRHIQIQSTNFGSSVGDFISQNSMLSTLLKRAELYESRGPFFLALLPEGLRQHVQFSSMEGTIIRFLVTSSAWATRLRLVSDSLILLANKKGYMTTDVVIQVKRS